MATKKTTSVKTNKGMNNSKKATSVAQRIAALKAAGISTSGMLSVADANGDGFVMRLVNGKLTMVDANTGKPVAKAKAKTKKSAGKTAKAIAITMVESGADAQAMAQMYDDVEAQIIESGYVKNTKLFRRWVMAQVFRMLKYQSYDGSKRGFVNALRARGYEYQWSMVEEELRVLSKLQVRDEECYAERSRFFNKEVLIGMFQDYLNRVTEYINGLEVRHYRHREYKRLYGRDDIFCDEIDGKVYKYARLAMRKIDEAQNAQEIYEAFRKYNGKRKHLDNWNTPMSLQFIDAYKGAGAFYTMKNMVLFHGCCVVDENGQRMGKYQSMAYINSKADEYMNGEGWKLFGVMKKLIDDNREALGGWAEGI